jgi:CubicO group peptidase (beta-lactamase class C family)
MSTVHGTAEKGFEALREAFAEGQAPDRGGAQLCVYRFGHKVVDLWTGTDPLKDRPYTDKTVGVIMSCSKGAVATMAHMLAERGQLDLDAPVTKYWPEFGQAGKQDVPVHLLLSHRVGLTSFEPESGIGHRELLDWKKCTEALAAMKPLWEPGTAYMYHAVTYGYLVGEVIKRVTGKTPGTLFREEIAGPLGLQMWLGLPESEESRVALHFNDRLPITLE